MRAMLNHCKSASAATLLAFAGLFSAASAQTRVVVTQTTQVGVYPSAGGLSGGNIAGSTMGVNSLGNVIFGNSYGNDVLQLVPSTGAVTILGAPGNVGAVAVDSSSNYYFTNLYGTSIVKVPFVGGAYAAFNANPSAKCVGGDTAACQIQGLTNGANGYYFGVLSLTFDPAGNLFFGLTNGNTAPNAIFECTVACQNGTGTATLLYQEPTNAAAQLILGGMATDSSGNLFFTDSAEPGNQVSTRSNLNELVYTSGTGYAARPTVLYTYTPGANSTGGDEIDTVNTDSNNVYFATTYGGIFALPSNKGVVNTAAIFAVSAQGAKIMATDGKGNFFADTTAASGDVIVQSAVGTVTAPATNVGSSTRVAGVTTLLNDGACTSTAVTYLASTTEFSANTTGSTCATVFGLFGSFSTNLTFTPALAGTRTATLTATDGMGSVGTAALLGTGVSSTVATPAFSPAAGAYTSAQTVALSDTTAGASIYYTTDGSTPTTASTLYTAPLTVSATRTVKAIAVATGYINSAVATATYTITLPVAATPVLTPAAGTYTAVQTVSITSSTAGVSIYYTNNGTTPTAASMLYTGPIAVANSQTIQAIAIGANYTSSAVASAAYVITLPAASAPAVVISQTTQAGAYPSAGGLSGANIAGSTMAVNQQGNLIFGNSYGNDVLQLVPSTGVVTILGAPGNVGAVAVDTSNNYYFATLYGSTVVKIPYSNGAYAAFNSSPSVACAGNDKAACYIPGLTNGANGYYFGVLSMTVDASGNLFLGLTNGNTAPNAIFECTAACATGNGTATLLYQEPTNAAAQLILGGMATDSSGNLFFTDSAETSAQVSTQSNLRELRYTAATGFATVPTLLYTYTPAAGSGDEIDAVNVDSNYVYFATTNLGIFGMVNVNGVVNTASLFKVSSQGAKVLATNGKGTFFADTNTASGDIIAQTTVGAAVAPTSAIGTAATATNLTTVLNDGSCTTSPSVTFTSSTAEFAAATSGACTATAIGTNGTFATTLTFTPSATSTRSAVLTGTDSLKNSGTAAVSGVGTTQPQTATPTYTPAAGTYTTAQSVTIADTTPAAKIYYTTDGSTPTTGSTLYSGAIAVATTQTVNSIAVTSGFSNSAVASALYTINPPAAAPTFTPAAGTYTAAQSVTIADTTPAAIIYYTTDGSAPTTGSTLYSGAIAVPTTQTIRAIATAANFSSSTVASALYTINLPAATPTFTPAAGTYTTVQSVTIATSTAGATVYYTTNGTAPTTSSTVYTGPVSVGVSETLQAIATAPNSSTSAIGSAAYVINLPTATPTFTPAAGSYTSIQTVSIGTTTPGATIYYTTAGTAPTTGSPVYTGPVTVGVTETLMALAVAPGHTPSAIGAAAYTITLPPPTVALTITPGSLTIKNGATGTVAVTVTPANSFAGQVTFTCAGLPADAACSFSPTPLAVAGAPATTTLTIVTTTVYGAHHAPRLPWLPGTGITAAAFSLIFLRRRRTIRSLLLVLVGMVTLGMAAGCGVEAKPGITHTPTTSVVSVTATAGAYSNTANFTLNVQ